MRVIDKWPWATTFPEKSRGDIVADWVRGFANALPDGEYNLAMRCSFAPGQGTLHYLTFTDTATGKVVAGIIPQERVPPPADGSVVVG